MSTLSSETIRQVTIMRKTFLLNEGHDTQGPWAEPDKTSTVYVVEVSMQDDGASANFDTLAEAEAYAAEVCQRPLKPFSLDSILSENR